MHPLVTIDEVGLEHSNQLQGHHKADRYQIVVQDEESQEVEEKAFRGFIVSPRLLFQVPVSFSVFQPPVLNLVGPGGYEGDGDQDEEQEDNLDVCHFFHTAGF